MECTDRGSRERTSAACVAWARVAVLPVVLALGTTVALCGTARAEPAAPTAADSQVAEIVETARDGQITDAVAQRLDAGQLYELVRHAQELRAEKRDDQYDFLDKTVVPVVAVGVFFTACVLAIFFPLYYAYRRSRKQQDIMMAMVDKGMQIPPYLVAPARRARNDLRTGIILLCTGAGICLALLGLPDFVWQLGLVPLAIGAGYVVVGLLDRSRVKGGVQATPGSDHGEATKA